MKKSETTIPLKMHRSKALHGLSVHFLPSLQQKNVLTLSNQLGVMVQVQYSAENSLSNFDKDAWISELKLFLRKSLQMLNSAQTQKLLSLETAGYCDVKHSHSNELLVALVSDVFSCGATTAAEHLSPTSQSGCRFVQGDALQECRNTYILLKS